MILVKIILSSSKKSIVTFNDLKVISSNFSFLQSEDIKAIFLDGTVNAEQ